MIKGNCTMAELMALPSREPEGCGRHFMSVDHGWLASKVMDTIEGTDWIVKGVAICAVSKDLLVSTVCVAFEKTSEKELSYFFGVRNPNDRVRKIEFFGGVSGSFGVVLSKGSLGIKHTILQDIPTQLEDALAEFTLATASYRSKTSILSKEIICQSEALELLARAGRDHILPWSRVGRVDKAIRGYFDKLTRWKLLVETCKVIRMNPPCDQLDQMWAFYGILMEKEVVSK